MAKNKSFEENMERLQTIVTQLNSESLALDDSLKLFEEGLSCVKSCDKQLKVFEKKYNEVYKKEEINQDGE